MTTKPIGTHVLNPKTGRLEPTKRSRGKSVSEHIRQRKSKRVKPTKRLIGSFNRP